MMNKRVEFRYFPLSRIQIGDKNIYYVGEREPAYHEVIFNGDPLSGKFIAYFVFGNEVVGFLTCGY